MQDLKNVCRNICLHPVNKQKFCNVNTAPKETAHYDYLIQEIDKTLDNKLNVCLTVTTVAFLRKCTRKA